MIKAAATSDRRIRRGRIALAAAVAACAAFPAAALADPAVTLTTPPANATTTYPTASVPAADFSCTPDPSSTLSDCSATVDGGSPFASGTPLPSAPGTHTLIATATDADGATATATGTYEVADPAPPPADGAPTAQITSPGSGGNYLWQSLPAAGYTCDAGTGATLASCSASSAGTPVADGGALPDSLGTHTLTVTATDTDGQASTQSVSYTAALSLAPPVLIQTPGGQASYRLGQRVIALYSCGVRPSGSPLKTCSGTVPSGHAVNTSTLGVHAFSAKAVDTSGQSSTESITYAVVPTTNRFKVSRMGATGHGVARVTVTLPGPGRLAVVANAWSAGGPAAFQRHFVYASATRRARTAGPLKLAVSPNGRGRALLKAAGAEPILALAITYTPTGATPHVVRPRALRLR